MSFHIKDAMSFTTRYKGAQVAPFCPAADLEALCQNKGVNLVRYQITGAYAENYSAYDWQAWVRSHLEHLETLGGILVKYGIRVVLDIHTPPGGFFQGHAALFLDGHWGRLTLENMWVEIATRYKFSSLVYAYDLLNEPAGNRSEVGELMTQLHTAIRQVDSKKRIIVSSAYGDINGLSSLPRFEDDSMWYTFHNYYPFSVCMQGIGSNPAPRTYPTAKYNYGTLKKHLQKAADFQAARKIQVYVGEFSISSFTPTVFAVQWLSDVIRLYREFGFQWTYHAWRESFVWNAERDDKIINTLRAGWKK